MIIEHIGKSAMLEQLAEECSELSQAALKLARIMRRENPSPVSEPVALYNLTEEIADVQLCIDELINSGVVSKTDAQDIRRLKEQRAERRMKDMELKATK